MSKIETLRRTFSAYGLIGIFRLVASYIKDIRVRIQRRRMLNDPEMKPSDFWTESFFLHQKRYESVSGVGSTIAYTESLRHGLTSLFEDFEINSLLDAPCGDFNWMRFVVQDANLRYLGADIVDELVRMNTDRYGNERIHFERLDITTDPLPSADLMICRDCLFHLSYNDIHNFIANFLRSDIPLLLTTTHRNHSNFSNQDIVSGDFRLIDLFAPPFGFPRSPLASIEDWRSPEPERDMVLFSKEQIAEIVLLS